jgi:hypothetical protein
MLPFQADRTALEVSTVTITNTATDAETPPQSLHYQLLNPPSGMQVSTNGVITWMPGLNQSPTTNLVITIVTDNGLPPLSATNSFKLVVQGPYDGIDLAEPSAAVADLDGDGLSNLMEYALGTDPRQAGDATTTPLASSIVPAGGAQYATLQFKRRKMFGGIFMQYIPEVSADGQIWYSDAAHVQEVSTTSLDDQFDLVVVQDQFPTSASTPRFFRLRVLEP